MPAETEKKDFFKDFERRNPQDVRRLFYLSRNSAWVMIDEDIYRVRFTNNLKTYQCQNGTYTRIYTTSSPLAPEEELELKLLLGKTFTQITAIDKNTHYYLDETAKLPHLMLHAVEYDFASLQMNMGNRNIALQLTIDNFDAYFIKKFNQCATKTEEEKLKQGYHLDKFHAIKNAIKNEIWLSVASGDWKTFALIYDRCLARIQTAIAHAHVSIPEIEKNSAKSFLYESYSGETIIQALWQANPTLNPPFSNDPPNYSNILSLLLTKGRFDLNMVELLKQSPLHQYRFFKQTHNAIPNEPLTSLTQQLKSDMGSPVATISPAA